MCCARELLLPWGLLCKDEEFAWLIPLRSIVHQQRHPFLVCKSVQYLRIPFFTLYTPLEHRYTPPLPPVMPPFHLIHHQAKTTADGNAKCKSRFLDDVSLLLLLNIISKMMGTMRRHEDDTHTSWRFVWASLTLTHAVDDDY